MNYSKWAAVGLLGFAGLACTGGGRLDAPPNEGIHGYANGCFALEGADPDGSRPRFLTASGSGDSFEFSKRRPDDAARFHMKPSDLGTYLFYDEQEHHLVAGEDGSLGREADLLSDVLTVDDDFDPGAEWALETSEHDPERFQLRHLATGRYLGREGLVEGPAQAAVVTPFPATGCAEFPELTVDAEGEARAGRFEDGSVFGIADTHSHIMSNFAFGGGGIFHGAPFHPLGVEHALPDCETYHGPEGRQDLMGYVFDRSGADGLDESVLITGLVTGMTPEFNHETAGYPDFTFWPSAHFSSTHQTQYYKWLERAYLGGLRLVVQHATSNQIICDLMAGADVQPVRYPCNDMVAIDRIIEETYRMERYIDAQEGGPGEGWFRIVTSPEEARAVIDDGKMAVVLGIEVSNLFDCLLVPPADGPACDEQYVRDQLDHYHDLGVRAIFPVHKFDNAFSAGDGDRVVMEIGNFFQTGHWSNFVPADGEPGCPEVPNVFDKGPVEFGGINQPRDEYDEDPPNDMSGFGEDPIGTSVDFLDPLFDGGRLEGDHCQKHGLTLLGQFLMEQMMQRGMIIEIDHFNRRSYERAFEILEANDYPAAGTHGLNNGGALYALGGISKTGLGRCRDASQPATMDDRLQSRIDLIRDNGGFPAEGFGFDLNGFAGAPGPRLGPDSVCSEPQSDPITYPFDSYGGEVTFTEPRLGNRTVDFNTEGFVHIGMLPELIEDARQDGVTDEDLEPLFKSAEGYLRMWERARERGEALSAVE
ncbi:MAG: hypothetical protein ACOC97_04670 [Myxococcota bacterium]